MGSLFIVESENRAAVVDFNWNDPFCARGIWQPASIYGFEKKIG